MLLAFTRQQDARQRASEQRYAQYQHRDVYLPPVAWANRRCKAANFAGFTTCASSSGTPSTSRKTCPRLYAGGLSRQGVNFRGGTLSTKQRVWSAWSSGGTLRNTSSTFGCSLSKCQQQQKTRQKAPADRLTSGTLAQPEPTGLFRRRTIRSPNRIRTFNPRVNSLLLTSGAGFSQRADRAPEPNRFEPPTRQ